VLTRAFCATIIQNELNRRIRNHYSVAFMPVKPDSLTEQELKSRYDEITTMYDLAEELVSTVESEFVSNPDAQMTLVEPLVEQVGDSADVLTEEFINVAQSTGNRTKIEGALRKLYLALDDYKRRLGVENTSVQKLVNIADPIVDKIKRQAEKIITVFLEFIDLSLDRIMHKAEVEELKKREEKVASMLHQISQHQHHQQ
jgi:hypothetical protein